MASNIDVVKTILSYNISVLCLYLCVCMSVANIGPYFKTNLQNSRYFLQCPLPLLGTSVAALQYVMYTSGFVDDVMFSRNDKVTKTPSACHSIR